ncbi:MAG: RNA polymerase sigma factor RpoE [Candidatus Methanofastidiosum methylothiophilum]|uniref:RNA polymerase sigma factor RpoE n=1 Tax=Candidatus Methanofastidiosum methylothiophilum TaxID=1705564 RepID=A0A150IQC8_9EURY|nr:MAG: RNA polymerase sigma factor RpoE [Candidatus Methanofastidiosum methylthiophilus]
MLKEKFARSDFESLYEVFQPKILDFLQKKVSNKETAEDLTSEVFEKVLKTIEDFQWQGISVGAWIFRIARNHLIDYYRKMNKYKNDKSFEDIVNLVESTLPNAEMEVERDEEDIQLFNALKELPEDDQYLIYYKFFEEMGNSRIAQITGLSETNIGTRLHRIRKKLAKIIESKQRVSTK